MNTNPSPVRTFQAPTMAAALEKIEQELGPQAVVVSVRELANQGQWPLWKRPGVEVLAMDAGESIDRTSENRPTSPLPVRQPAPRPDTRPSNTDPDPAELLRLLAGLEKETTSQKARPSGALQEQLASQLESQGLAAGLAQKVLASARLYFGRGGSPTAPQVMAFLTQQLNAEIKTSSWRRAASERVVFVAGKSGSGKTSSLAKLAVHLMEQEGKHVGWICTDTIRTGAIGEAQAYTQNLRMPLRVAYTPEDLMKAVAGFADMDVILVDTPRCNFHRKDSLVELTSLITVVPRRSLFWVFPAGEKDENLTAEFNALSVLSPGGIIATKLDESATSGTILNAAWRSHLPLVYFTSGPGPLTDLHPADLLWFVKTHLMKRWN